MCYLPKPDPRIGFDPPLEGFKKVKTVESQFFSPAPDLLIIFSGLMVNKNRFYEIIQAVSFYSDRHITLFIEDRHNSETVFLKQYIDVIYKVVQNL